MCIRDSLDPEVYIRSMASRGHLGGLSWTTPQAIRVLDAAGCQVVLVETVGVGQSEVEIAGLADTTIVLLAPGTVSYTPLDVYKRQLLLCMPLQQSLVAPDRLLPT